MNEPRFTRLSELVEAVRSGDVDEASIEIVMDNDCSTVYGTRDPATDDAPELYNGKGYADTEDLWKALFPKADVRWC